MSLLNPIAFTGVGGNVQIAGTTLSVREWKVTIESDAINVTSTNDGGYRNFITGPVGMTGEFRINADCGSFAPAAPTNWIPTATECPNGNAPATGNGFVFIFTLGTSGHQITGSGLITRVEINNPASEEVTISYSFVGTKQPFVYS